MKLTPGVIEPWEAILTFLFFFAIIVSAYLADKKLFYKSIFKFRRNRKSFRIERPTISTEKIVSEDSRSVSIISNGMAELNG